MFYILDDLGYIEEVSTHYIERDSKTCTEYTGAIPEGYETLDNWVLNANIRAYKLDADGNLIFDEIRDAELQKEYNAKIPKYNIITAGLKSSKSINFTTYTEIKISLDNELKVGNKLTLSNGSVVIGKGVKLVKVNANARLDASANATVYALKIWIHKSDGTLKKVFAHYFYKVNTSYDLPMCITSVLAEVEEGDTISLITQSAASQTKKLISPDTYLTVEVVD